MPKLRIVHKDKKGPYIIQNELYRIHVIYHDDYVKFKFKEKHDIYLEPQGMSITDFLIKNYGEYRRV